MYNERLVPKPAPVLSHKLCAVTLISVTPLIFETQSWCIIVCTTTVLVNTTEKKEREEVRSPPFPSRKLRHGGLKMERVWLLDLAESSDNPCLQSYCHDVLAAPEAAATAPQSRCSSAATNPVLRRCRPTLHHSPCPRRCRIKR